MRRGVVVAVAVLFLVAAGGGIVAVERLVGDRTPASTAPDEGEAADGPPSSSATSTSPSSGVCGPYGAAEVAFTFADAGIVESSGVAAATRSPGITFTHNDSGDESRFFAVRPDGRTAATFTLTGPDTSAFDWEDMAAGPGADGKPALFLGDIGDNRSARKRLRVHEVAEPVVDAKATGATTGLTPTVHVLSYEDGAHDAETLLVDRRGRIHVVTKDSGGRSGLYGVDEKAGSESASPRVLRRLADVDVRRVAGGGEDDDLPLLFSEATGGLAVTGGAVSHDGRCLALRTYGAAWEWEIPEDGDLAAALAGTPSRLELPAVLQGEALTYDPDGNIILTTEGSSAPVHRLPKIRG